MSSKVRVYELARETGLENKEVLRRLDDLGIEASTHSSSVEGAEAQLFLESLGQSQAEREAEEERRRQKEAEELERFKNMSSVAPPEQRKARRVLPPHLRQQQEEQEAAAAAAAPATEPDSEPEGGEPAVEEAPEPAAAPDEVETPSQPAAAPQQQPQTPAAPAAETRQQPSGEAQRGDGPRMPGAPPPPAAKSSPTPSGPRPAVSRRPPAPPTVTGDTPRQRRVHESKMPKEGSGKRSIPPPLRKAPARPPQTQPARKDTSPYKQPVGRKSSGKPGGGPPDQGGGPGSPRGRTRRKEKTAPQEHELDRKPVRRNVPIEEQVRGSRVEVLSGITVGELADKLDVNASGLVKKLFEMGEMATVQQSLPDDTIEIVCDELGVEVYFLSEEEVEFGVEEPDQPDDLRPRPPVVTVMGHVDHGKTLLLDAIRETDVVSTEAGGITQHIGAYQVRRDDRVITFIDTPGHEAFTAMRARGAQVTDIAVLVVAADDGVMPQTVEAIAHARAADVPLVIAVNKMDLETANPDRVKAELTEHELVVEDLGGEVPCVLVSAKTHEGLDELIEILAIQADIMELTANPDKPARGRVIEAHLDKGRGPVATLLVQAGTLRPGDVLVAGISDGKVRAAFGDAGKEVDKATPGQPVQILGLNDVPEAGDDFRVVSEERFSRDVAERRSERRRRKELAEQQRPKTLEDLTAEVEAGEKATLNIIIKADVSGSAEALEDALSQLELEEVQVRVVHKGVGGVTENDVRLAEASDAIIVAFNVRPDANARDAIEASGVDLRSYGIIYEAIEDIERAVKGLLAPEFEEVMLGELEVREVFRVPRVGNVFGCFVTEGEIRRDARLRVVREGVVVAEDTVTSLKRFKDDVREVSEGYECGVGLDKFQDVKVGDRFEVFAVREISPV